MPSSAPNPEHRSLRELIAAPDYFARVGEAVLQIQAAPDAPLENSLRQGPVEVEDETQLAEGLYRHLARGI